MEDALKGMMTSVKQDWETPKDFIVTAHWNNHKNKKLGGFTSFEDEEIRKEILLYKKKIKIPFILNLFCGGSKIGVHRVDVNKQSMANYQLDCLEFLDKVGNEFYDIVIADPSYNGKFIKKYNTITVPNYTCNSKNLTDLRKEMDRVLKPGGLFIFKHWFAAEPGKNYILEKQIVTKYGGYRRITIMTFYKKVLL